MPKSACTNGSATGTDHMPTLPMVPTATANPSRRHAACESTSLSWRSRKSKELPGNEFTTRTSHAQPVPATYGAHGYSVIDVLLSNDGRRNRHRRAENCQKEKPRLGRGSRPGECWGLGDGGTPRVRISNARPPSLGPPA